MTEPHEQPPNGALIGPLAVRLEKLGIAIQVAVLLAFLLVLIFLDPENGTFLYIFGGFLLLTTVLSALRLRKLLRGRDRSHN